MICAKKIGQSLLQVRLARGLSEKDVVMQTDLSLISLQNIESGGNAAWAKYKKLLFFYRLDWQIILIDKK